MIRSKIERSIGFSRIHYLWFSIVLLFPPVHEFGHACIAVLMGDKIIEYGFLEITRLNAPNIYQMFWQYSLFVPLICVWFYYIVTRYKNPMWIKGVKFYGKKTTV